MLRDKTMGAEEGCRYQSLRTIELYQIEFTAKLVSSWNLAVCDVRSMCHFAPFDEILTLLNIDSKRCNKQ